MPFFKLDDLPEVVLAKGIFARVVTADSMTVAHVRLVAGAVLPEHAHINEQVVNVVAGHLELTVAGQRYDLVPGTALVLPSNVPHSGRAVTECLVIDVFHPVREDFRRASFAGYTTTDNA